MHLTNYRAWTVRCASLVSLMGAGRAIRAAAGVKPHPSWCPSQLQRNISCNYAITHFLLFATQRSTVHVRGLGRAKPECAEAQRSKISPSLMELPLCLFVSASFKWFILAARSSQASSLMLQLPAHTASVQMSSARTEGKGLWLCKRAAPAARLWLS